MQLHFCTGDSRYRYKSILLELCLHFQAEFTWATDATPGVTDRAEKLPAASWPSRAAFAPRSTRRYWCLPPWVRR